MLRPVSARRAVLVALGALVGAVLLGVSMGPADLSLTAALRVMASHIPLLHIHSGVGKIDADILWQIRLPRVVLGGLVGAMLAGGGAAFQGVFRNPLADPYLLGVAAGAGLGATAVIVAGPQLSQLLPLAAFAGAVGAVTLTYVVGATVGRQGATVSIVLAGVAVAALLTAIQTFLQQQHAQDLQSVYAWILGSLTVATWSQVVLILPYVAVSALVLLAHRRFLDVLRVGEDEADSLGVRSSRVRITIVAAATLGTAAAVAVSGLIGFVGIIVPHTVRLTTNASYRVVVPVSMIGGAAFLILADVAARTVLAPSEIPIGVVTAFVGAPFFLFVLRSRRVGRST
jgi:iron complex transport system permease protein